MTTTLTPDTGAPAAGMPANDTLVETAAVLLIESLHEGAEVAAEVLPMAQRYFLF